MSGSGISWAICKSAPCSRQITTPASHHSVFLQAGCSSCRPTNSVKALKANSTNNTQVLASNLTNPVVFLFSYETLSADHIRPRCMDEDPGFRRCDSGQLTFNEELTLQFDSSPSVNITHYEQVYGQYAALRPVYKATVSSSSVSVYLYHTDGTWRLGYDYTTSASPLARVSDTALRPEFITGIWQLQFGGWRSNSNLKVRCTGTFYH